MGAVVLCYMKFCNKGAQWVHFGDIWGDLNVETLPLGASKETDLKRRTKRFFWETFFPPRLLRHFCGRRKIMIIMAILIIDNK